MRTRDKNNLPIFPNILKITISFINLNDHDDHDDYHDDEQDDYHDYHDDYHDDHDDYYDDHDDHDEDHHDDDQLRQGKESIGSEGGDHRKARQASHREPRQASHRKPSDENDDDGVATSVAGGRQ